MAIRNTRNDAAVISIKNITVITYLSIFQEQVGEIRTPCLICPFSSEILGQLIFKYLVWLFGYRTVMEAFTCQINRHTPVSIYPIVFVVNFSFIVIVYLMGHYRYNYSLSQQK